MAIFYIIIYLLVFSIKKINVKSFDIIPLVNIINHINLAESIWSLLFIFFLLYFLLFLPSQKKEKIGMYGKLTKNRPVSDFNVVYHFITISLRKNKKLKVLCLCETGFLFIFCDVNHLSPGLHLYIPIYSIFIHKSKYKFFYLLKSPSLLFFFFCVL